MANFQVQTVSFREGNHWLKFNVDIQKDSPIFGSRRYDTFSNAHDFLYLCRQFFRGVYIYICIERLDEGYCK